MEEMKEMLKNNQVELTGELVSNCEFSHKVHDENFYIIYLSSERLSTTADVIPVLISSKIIDVNEKWEGRYAKVSGQFRSYNDNRGGKARLILTVFAREFEECEADEFRIDDKNEIFLNAVICRTPTYRKTPLGRQIADLLVAVNRPYGESDYIPCIAWGRNARFASGLEVGKRLQIEGRIQSREYVKKKEDGEFEKRTAYEVSVSKMEVEVNEQRED